MERGGGESRLLWMEAATGLAGVSRQSTATTYFVNKLHNDELQDVSEGVDLVDAGAQVIQSPILCGNTRRKGISEMLLHR